MNAQYEDNQPDRPDEWDIWISNRTREEEITELTRDQLCDVVATEWAQDCNALMIGHDYDCVGKLFVFFSGERGFVEYGVESVDVRKRSFNLIACEAEDWHDEVILVCGHDWVVSKCNMISKAEVHHILNQYIFHGTLEGLYARGEDGRPILR